nr:GNAT family N-acetyltransferase [Nocardioidaceae bacterium]
MDIRPIDVHDDDTFGCFYEIMRAAELFERPGMPMWSHHEAAVMFRAEDPDEETRAYAAYEGASMVGIAAMFLPLSDNLDKVYAEISVAPEQRRLGVGSALLNHVVADTQAVGRTTLLSMAKYAFADRETHPYRRFAEKHGFTLASVEIQRALPLPVSGEVIQRWIDEAQPHHTDYQIETFVDHIPEELLDSYLYLLNQLAVDAPTGDVDYEPEGQTPESFRIHQDTVKKQGRTVYA